MATKFRRHNHTAQTIYDRSTGSGQAKQLVMVSTERTANAVMKSCQLAVSCQKVTGKSRAPISSDIYLIHASTNFVWIVYEANRTEPITDVWGVRSFPPPLIELTRQLCLQGIIHTCIRPPTLQKDNFGAYRTMEWRPCFVFVHQDIMTRIMYNENFENALRETNDGFWRQCLVACSLLAVLNSVAITDTSNCERICDETFVALWYSLIDIDLLQSQMFWKVVDDCLDLIRESMNEMAEDLLVVPRVRRPTASRNGPYDYSDDSLTSESDSDDEDRPSLGGKRPSLGGKRPAVGGKRPLVDEADSSSESESESESEAEDEAQAEAEDEAQAEAQAEAEAESEAEEEAQAEADAETQSTDTNQAQGNSEMEANNSDDAEPIVDEAAFRLLRELSTGLKLSELKCFLPQTLINI
jgi:hypothetical protein